MLLAEELQKVGLPEKQALIYLALLELGPSTVQRVARKANIPRATTYVLITCLINLGLVNKTTIGKRPLFRVEQPQHLLGLIDTKQKVLANHYRDIEQLIPSLQALYFDNNPHPSVRYYPGRHGLLTIRQEIAQQCSHKDVWYRLVPADQIVSTLGRHHFYCRERVAKGIQSKLIFTTTSEITKTYILRNCVRNRTEGRYISPNDLTIRSGITICQDKVAISSYQPAIGGMLVHDPALAQTLRQFFDLVWRTLE